MIKAVIFDMDGVLVDSEIFYLEYWYDFFEQHHQSITLQQLHPTAGMNMTDFWTTIGAYWNPKKNGKEMEDYFYSQTEYPTLDYQDLARPHLHYLLKRLHNKNIKCAIASANFKEEIQAMLEQTNTQAYFDVIMSGEELENSKPAPDIYLHTMEKLGVKPEETVVVEDSTYGIESGKAAGAYVIAMEEKRFSVAQEKADGFATDFMDVYHQIMEL